MSTQKERPYKTTLTDKVDLLFEVKTSESGNLRSLSLSSIQLSEFQPRSYFDKVKLEELAQTIAIHGVLEPLLVREQGNVYELIAGGRRYQAAQLAGLSEVPVLVLDLTDQQCLEVAILENFQREDLNPIEETEGILRLLESRLQQERNNVTSLLYRLRNQQLSQSSRNVSPNPEIEVIKQVFEPLGMNWKSFVETRLPLLKLPEDILQALREGRIEYTKAKVIAKLGDQQQREALLEKAILEELSLSQIKQEVSLLSKAVEVTLDPQKEIQDLSQKLKKSQLWKKDPKKWKKAQGLLEKLRNLIVEGMDDSI